MGIGDTVTVLWSHSATGFLGSDYRTCRWLSVPMQTSWLGLWNLRTSEMGRLLVATIWIPSGEFLLLPGDGETEACTDYPNSSPEVS